MFELTYPRYINFTLVYNTFSRSLGKILAAQLGLLLQCQINAQI